jgi:hypothetical protein
MLQEKIYSNILLDNVYNNLETILEIKQKEELFECYYCHDFLITDKKEYEKHVVLKHPNNLAFHSLTDLKKMNISPKGKN